MKIAHAGMTALVAGLFAVAPLSAQEGPPEDSGRPLTAALTGEAETGGGDVDGTGSASIRLNQGQGEICFDLTVDGIDAMTAAHIHRGAAGEDGPPVVTLDPLADFNGSACVAADAELIKEIRQNPSAFYVNVHNGEFPAGALRGQLEKGM